MDNSTFGLLALIALLAIHALLVLIHAALSNTRAAWLEERIEEGNRRARQALILVHSGPNLTVTYQILVTLLRFGLAAVALVVFADGLLATNESLNPTMIYLVILLVTATLTLILGELVPEAVGSTYANNLTLLFTPVMQALMLVLSPLVIAVLQISRIISSLLGSSSNVNLVTEEEIMTLIDAGHTGGTIEDEEKDMIYSVLQLDQTRASEVMVPRIDIVAVEINTPPKEAGAMFIDSGFSRIPVYEHNIDSVKGLLYAKDLLEHCYNGKQTATSIRELMRPPHFVPETKPADELLKELKLRMVHLAIVVDEYGGTAGLVTIENIIEEIIGDIQDEYDINEEAEYEKHGPDEYMMDASIDLDDVNDMLDIDLPTEDSDTLGGYIYTHFGRVPEIGETIEEDLFTLQVRSVDGRRIRKVHVIRKRPTLDEDTNDTTRGADTKHNSEPSDTPDSPFEAESSDRK